MKILNAMQLKNGAKTKQSRFKNLTQPLQFLPQKEKDQEWAAQNMDWLEWQGLKQLSVNARRFMKNYKLAEGIIDKTDYISEVDNEMRDLIDTLVDNPDSALELKFYPIIPNIIKVLLAEFAKRNARVSFRASDEYTYNEILERKRAAVEDVLVKKAEMRFVNQLIEAGADPEDPEIKQSLEQQLSPENLKTLPEIQDFYSKNYEVLAEKWASKQHVIDEERFKMDELEERAFHDMLCTDREFWHFNMYEDDYDIELWNPVLTFYHKSPTVRYISSGNWVGKSEMASIPEIIDKFGWKMTADQIRSLEQYHSTKSAGFAITGQQNDGSFYDPALSHGENLSSSVAMKQFNAMTSNFVSTGGDIVDWILGQSEDGIYNTVPGGNSNLMRVTQCYWKSQRKLGHLTKISEDGSVIIKVVDENYKITDQPVYNNTLIKNKTKDQLIFGEHIDWIYNNQTYGGIKIGPNFPTHATLDHNGFRPIYLGINQNKIKPLKFQFKGDNQLYGCKLPVEGRVFSDRNVRSTALVDLVKPFQIGYNMVNNQIADILVDELGSIIVLDQNTLPQHSLGEDWGKGNYSKAYVAMKDFSVLPLDTGLANTEGNVNFQQFQQLDMSQTARLLGRVQLANFFKQEAYAVVGVTPQRLGQQIGQTNTATGIEQAVAGSYAQTEQYFTQHSDHLMPRVHQMRTDLAQFYQSKKPSIRLQHMTSEDERVNFEIHGTDLLLRDINCYCTTKASHRNILEQLQTMAKNNNTTGASLYDIGKLMQADSMATLNASLKGMEEKQKEQHVADQQHQERLKQMEIDKAKQEKLLELDHESREAEKERRKDILVAEIRASGFGAMQDINENQQSDFKDAMDDMRQRSEYQEATNLQKTKESNRAAENNQKNQIKREEMSLKRELKEKDLEIARTNKNQYDKPNNSKEKKKK